MRLKIINPVKKTFKLLKIRPRRQKYIPISKRLPMYYEGATPPRPDHGHLISNLCGVAKRVAVEPPKMDRKLARGFKRFVQLWLKRNVRPLTEDENLSFEEWLDGTDYPEARKNELRRVWEDCGRNPSQHDLSKISSFIKDESYPEYKFPRTINSRSDKAKCLFGPLVASISAKIFKLHWFIKTIPVVDRPSSIYNKLYKDRATYVSTDYTSFEAHFKKALMRICESEMFRYMVQNLGFEAQEICRKFILTKESINRVSLSLFDYKVEACRMSGEMDTSLSNGFTNLMLYLYASYLEGCTEEQVHGFVEGDDGIFRNDGPMPTEETFKKLGMTIKIATTKTLSTASFCGQVYDVEDMTVVTDVREAVARLGWTNKFYTRSSKTVLRELLRAKGFSLCYQYGKCPILWCLGVKILELTSGVTVRQSIIDKMDSWERGKYLEALKCAADVVAPPGLQTRQLVERLYGVTIDEQLEIEASIMKMSELGPMPFQFVNIPSDWTHYYENYNSDDYNSPPVWIRDQAKTSLEQLLQVKMINPIQFKRLDMGNRFA